MNLLRTKTIEQSIADTEATEGSEHQLRKELGALQLTVFGVGVIIGTGIFVLTGEAAGVKAGPVVQAPGAEVMSRREVAVVLARIALMALLPPLNRDVAIEPFSEGVAL